MSIAHWASMQEEVPGIETKEKFSLLPLTWVNICMMPDNDRRTIDQIDDETFSETCKKPSALWHLSKSITIKIPFNDSAFLLLSQLNLVLYRPLMLFVQDQRKAVQLLKRFKCRIIGELSNWKLRWFDQLSFFSSDKFNFRFSSRFVKLPCHIVILSFYPIVELHYIVFYGHELHWYCRSDPEWVAWVWHWESCLALPCIYCRDWALPMKVLIFVLSQI